jgi:hypothetical protein
MPIEFPDNGKKRNLLENIDKAKDIAVKSRPPQIFEPRCNCCTSPHRQFIEGLLVKGANYVWISDNVPGQDGDKIDRRSVSNHAKKHMAYQDAAIRAVLEEEANVASQNYEEGVRGAVTHRGVLEVALRKAYEDIVSGATIVEARDMIQLINTLQKMDEQTEQVAVNELRAQVQAFVEAIRSETDPDTWDRIFRRMKSIMSSEGTGDIPDVEVVHATALPAAP